MRVGVLIRRMDKTGGTEAATRLMLDVLARAGHAVTLYTKAPPEDVPQGVAVAVQAGPAASPTPSRRPPLLGRFDFYQGGHEGLLGMSDDDALIVSDWEVFMEPTRARRILYYFHLPPDRERAVLAARLPLRRPRRWPRHVYHKRLVRARLSRFDPGRVVLVPNSRHTGGVVEAVFGRPAGPVLYPPVRVREMEAHRDSPKRRAAVTVANYWESKRHGMAMRAAAAAGVEWTSIGATPEPACRALADSLRDAAGPGADIRTNVGRAELVQAVSSSKVYLHAAGEPFGIAVVEAMAAGCVPIVLNAAANVETVPFDELRFDTEEEAAAKVQAAADGRYDRYLPRLAEHARTFSEEAFAGRLLEMVAAGGGEKG